MEVFFASLLSFDLGVFQWIQSIQNGFLDALMVGVTTLGNAGAIFIVLGFVLLFTKKYCLYIMSCLGEPCPST